MAWSGQIRRRVSGGSAGRAPGIGHIPSNTQRCKAVTAGNTGACCALQAPRRVGSPGQRIKCRPCRHFQIAQDGSGRKWHDPASPTPAVPDWWAGGLVGWWAGGLIGRGGGIAHTPADTCPRRPIMAGQGRDQRGPQAPKTSRAFRSARKAATIPTGARLCRKDGRSAASTYRQPDATPAVFAGRVGAAGGRAPGAGRQGRDGRWVLRLVAVVCVGTSLTKPGRAAFPARR